MEIIVVVIVPLVVVLWMFIIRLDKDRVRDHIETNGHSVVHMSWRLFGHGWLSEASKEGGGNRIYEVEYRDVYGNTHHVWAKTAMLSGVFLSQDKVIAHATASGRPMSAEEKIALLEEELKKARTGK